jgi:hypothetical protein
MVAMKGDAVYAGLQAMQHSWQAYEAYAWGLDELSPLTNGGKDKFGGLGATLIDSLDTLHMMGLQSEFKRFLLSLNSSRACQKLLESIGLLRHLLSHAMGFDG